MFVAERDGLVVIVFDVKGNLRQDVRMCAGLDVDVLVVGELAVFEFLVVGGRGDLASDWTAGEGSGWKVKRERVFFSVKRVIPLLNSEYQGT